MNNNIHNTNITKNNNTNISNNTMNYFKSRIKSHHNSGGIVDKYLDSNKISSDEFLAKLDEEPKDIPRAIYVHTPYCDKICSFCNLNRKKIDNSVGEYADFLASEFDKYGKTKYMTKPFNVVYFGGGTPTIYKPKDLETILQSVERNIIFHDDYEFTLETTLHNLNDEKIKLLNKYGVNRLSIGIQSFSDIGRKFYNRTFTKIQVMEKLEDLKLKFNGEVCVDIIYNFPNQKVEDAINDAKIIKKLDLGSSSFYSLMVHKGSDLSKNIDKGNITMQKELSKEKILHDAFVKELTNSTDYYPLELTKIAKKGRDSYQYIKVRNAGGDTFPIGAGAGGRIGNVSVFRMSKEMSFYVEKTDYHLTYEKLSGLMQFPIIDKSKIQKLLTTSEFDFFINKMSQLSKEGFIKVEENGYSFTKDGIFWGNNISSEILNSMAKVSFENIQPKQSS